MTSNPRGERRCMVGVGPQGETTFEPFVRAAWADAEIERLRQRLVDMRKAFETSSSDEERRLRAALEKIRNYPPRVLDSDRVEDMKYLAAHALDGGRKHCAAETPPAKDEVLEAVRAGRVTYPPEVLPTGRWMPAEETPKRRFVPGICNCETEAREPVPVACPTHGTERLPKNGSA